MGGRKVVGDIGGDHGISTPGGTRGLAVGGVGFTRGAGSGVESVCCSTCTSSGDCGYTKVSAIVFIRDHTRSTHRRSILLLVKPRISVFLFIPLSTRALERHHYPSLPVRIPASRRHHNRIPQIALPHPHLALITRAASRKYAFPISSPVHGPGPKHEQQHCEHDA